MQNQPQPPFPPVQITQPAQVVNSKCKVFIDNLDQGVQEDYLYKKFKEECGQILAIKINKDKSTQKSKGTAVITFSSQDYAEEARKRFNGSILIKNVIRVKPHLNIYEQDKLANAYIGDLHENVTIGQLEEHFSQYGNVHSIDIKLNEQGKSLGYGYIQFESKENVDKAIQSHLANPITFLGRAIKIEKFKSQSERQGATTSIFFRAFASPRDIDAKYVKAYEYGWKLNIQDHFQKKGNVVKSVFVKHDEKLNQPWAMVVFETKEEAQDAYNECESNRSHGSLKSSADKVWKLIQASGPSKLVDGTDEFKVADVAPFFQEQSQSQNDIYKGDTTTFFYNYMKSKHQNVDKRLLLARNIRADVDVDFVTKFFSQWGGTVVKSTVIKQKNPKFKGQQAFIHMQTEGDSTEALTKVYEKAMVEKVKEIFENTPNLTILVPKAVRRDYIQLKHSQAAARAEPTPSIVTKFLPQNMGAQFPARGPPQNRSLPHQFQQPMGQPPQMMGVQGQYPRPQGPPRGGQGRGYRQPYPQRGGYAPQGMPGIPAPGMIPNQFPQQGMQNFPQQGFPGPQGPQQRVIQPQPTVAPRIQFSKFEEVQQHMPQFLAQPVTLQRTQLGLLLNPLVVNKLKVREVDDIDIAQRITGMLIDEKLFEINEILQLFQDENELDERIDEGYTLINEGGNVESQN